MRGGLSGFLAGALSGYGTVMKFEREAEDAKARKADREFQQTQRERTLREQNKADALEVGVKAAAAPLTVEEQTAQDVMPSPAAAQGFMVGGVRYGDRGTAEKAVAAGNTPEGINARVAGFYRSQGKMAEASALERDALQTKAAGLQVKAAEQAQSDRDGLRKVVQLVAAGDAQGIARLYNENYNDGMTADVKLNPDGTFAVQRFKQDGTPESAPMTLRGDQLVAQMAAGYDPKLWSEGQRADRAEATAAAQRKEDKAYRAERDQVADKFKKQELDIKGEVAAARIDAATARAEAARARAAGGGAAAPDQAPVWDDKAAAFLRQRYTVTDPTTGQVGVDGAGLQFGKAVAVALSQTNGGDIDRAIGFAFEKDNELKALAKGDPAAHNALRQRYLQAIMTPAAPAATGAAPAAAPAPSKTPPQPRTGTPAAAAAQGVAMKGPSALRAAPQALSDAELVAVPPGHPAYQPAQEELKRRALAREAEARTVPPGMTRE